MKSTLSLAGFISLLLIGLLVIPGCLYQNEETLYPPETPPPPGFCDTTDVSYKNDIVPIMNESGCISCHSGAGVGGVALDSFEKTKRAVDEGDYLCAIEHGDGCDKMPQGGSKLAETKIELIRCWIEKGALDN